MHNIHTVTDKWNRPLQDLRISVTDRCNLRCTYCMPRELFGDDYAFMPKDELLTFEEMGRVVSIFAALGVKKVRITGGEPLLRRDLDRFIRHVATMAGIEDIALTTNGVLLQQQAHALKAAGLQRLNISLDALDPDIFGHMNGRGIAPSLILQNIDLAQSLGFVVKVNMVVQKGVNDGQILPMASYFKERGITLRFIEFMDVGNDNGWRYDQVVSKQEIVQLLSQHYELEPVAQGYYGEVANYYRYRDGGSGVGFITSVSEPFCSSCTRARISSDGKIYTCLFASNGFDLRALLRRGVTDEQLLEALRGLWSVRDDRYSEERTEHSAQHKKKIGMSYIGG